VEQKSKFGAKVCLHRECEQGRESHHHSPHFLRRHAQRLFQELHFGLGGVAKVSLSVGPRMKEMSGLVMLDFEGSGFGLWGLWHGDEVFKLCFAIHASSLCR
jgi:hypothetical protein